MNQKPTFAHEQNLCTCLECRETERLAAEMQRAEEGPEVQREANWGGFPSAPPPPAPQGMCPSAFYTEAGWVTCEGAAEHRGTAHSGFLPGAPGEREMLTWKRHIAEEERAEAFNVAGEPLGLEDDARFAHVRMVHLQLTGERARLRDMLAALDVACNDYDREGRELAADLGEVWP